MQKYKPTTVERFKAIGLKLTWLGEGAFRRTYKVVDLPLVVKLPIPPDGRSHANKEIRTLKRLLPFKFLRSNLPKVYYHDERSGVIAMHFYEPNKENDEQFNDDIRENAPYNLIGDLLFEMTRVRLSDLSYGNTMIDQEDKLKIVDLGL